MFQTNGPSGLIGVKDYCVDLKGAKILDELTNDALKLQEDGVVYGVDYVEEDYGIIYNKKLLEKAGYKGDDIKDFASLKKVVEDIQARKAELGVKGAFTSAGLDSSSDCTMSSRIPVSLRLRKLRERISLTTSRFLISISTMLHAAQLSFLARPVMTLSQSLSMATLSSTRTVPGHTMTLRSLATMLLV